ALAASMIGTLAAAAVARATGIAPISDTVTASFASLPAKCGRMLDAPAFALLRRRRSLRRRVGAPHLERGRLDHALDDVRKLVFVRRRRAQHFPHGGRIANLEWTTERVDHHLFSEGAEERPGVGDDHTAEFSQARELRSVGHGPGWIDGSERPVHFP